MGRKTATITRRDITTALSAITKKEIGPYEIGDDKCSGLSLRVRARSASWSLRDRLGGKQSTWTVAPVRPDDDPNEMRERTHQAKALLRRGIDPREWLQEKALGGQIERHFDEQRDGWTWAEARERFLTYVQAERRKATYDDYRKTLCGRDLVSWEDRLVKSITRRDIAALQDSIYARGAKVQATHTLRVVKVFMNWLSQRGDSGFEESPANSVKPISVKKSPNSLHVPGLVEIGSMPWLLDTAAVSPAARLAVMLTVLTAQRRETIVSATKDQFEEMQNAALWNIPSAHMKSDRKHTLPLPSLTWSIVKKAMALGRADSPWLFPQLRLRRKGDAGNAHMSAKTINDALAEIGVPMRPHDARRAFGTHGEALLGFKRSDSKAILDHAEGLAGDVTAEHYALHDGTHFKWPLMRTWEAFVVEQIEAQRPEGHPEALPGFLR